MEKVINYPPAEFHNHNLKDLVTVINETKFSTIVACDFMEVDAVFAPFFISKEQQESILSGKENDLRVLGHFHRLNHLKALLDEHKQIKVKIIFNCADCYVSPTVYQKKLTTKEVVPTWNYVAAQVTGRMKIVESEEELKKLLTQEVDAFEKSVGSDWRLNDAPEQYVGNMMHGIFGVEVEVDKFTVHKKLHQRGYSKRDIEKVAEWTSVAMPERRLVRPWMEDYLATLGKDK